MAFLAPAFRKSMDLQCGQRVEKNPTVARIMNLPPHEPRLRQDRRDLERVLNSVGGERFAGRSQRGSLRAPSPVVLAFSRRAPTVSPLLSPAQPGAYAVSVVFYPSAFLRTRFFFHQKGLLV